MPATDTPEVAAPSEGAVPSYTYDPQLAVRRTSPSGFLLDALRRRRLGRLLVSGLTGLLFVSGAGLFAYPLFTDLYTDQLLQGRLADQFASLEVDSVEAWETSTREAGSPLTRIVIPAIDVSTVVVSGTSPAALRAGAGHYPNTPLPGDVGNVGIAGHRTTYGRPFNRIDELTAGDEIWLLTPVGDYRYEVGRPPDDGDCVPFPEYDPGAAPSGSEACVTHPDDWSVVAPQEEALLTLTTCHPKGSARERLIIRAALVDELPAGGYQQTQQAAGASAAGWSDPAAWAATPA